MTPDPTHWQLLNLGMPRLTDPAGRQVQLTRKDAALLSYVAHHGEVPTTRVGALIWPQADERRALNNLRQRLHRLRRETGARLLEVGRTARLADDLVLAPRPDRAALEFDATAWNEELLGAHEYDDAEEFSAWLTRARHVWAEARIEALAGIASQFESSGQLARALVYAQHLQALQPHSEHAHRRVMRLHFLRGDAAAAVSHFEALERLIKDELGLKPSPETLELLRTVEHGARPTRLVGAAHPMPVGLVRPPRMVGRLAERVRLVEAARGGGIAVLLAEAGMGKTRLLHDVFAAQPRAVYAQARPGDAAVPYGALARLLRAVATACPKASVGSPGQALAHVVPEFGDGASAAAPAVRLQAAVEQLLLSAGCGGAPGAAATFILDDLHFADRASIEMLRALVDAESLTAANWVFAHRPMGMADQDDALLQSLADSPRASWIALPALNEADLRELLDSLALPGIDSATMAPALAQHTGGNPLYVLETLRSGQASAADATERRPLPRPPNIAHLIDRRLQRLSAPALALGRVAALAGADFSTALAEHALATPALLLADGWAELEAADVLRGTAFAHDLVRDGMLRATPAPIAVHAHRLIAQYLAAHGAEPARLAPHWLAAGECNLAADAFLDASNRAKAAGRPREQAQLLTCRADALERSGDRAAALRARIDTLNPVLQSEGGAAAVALTDRLLLERDIAPALAARIWSGRALALMWAGRIADAEPAAERALALADPGDDEVRINAVCMLAIGRSMGGDPKAGVALLDPWALRIEQVADAELRASFYGNLTNLLMQADRPEQALPAARRHLQLTRELALVGEQVTALMNLSNLLGRRGDLDDAVLHARQADALIADAGQSESLLAWNRTNLGHWLAGLGRFAEGLALLETAIDTFLRLEGSAMRLALAQDCCARVWLTLGQPARAHRLVAEQPEQPPGRLRARQMLVRAKVAQALGQPDAADLLQAVRLLVAEADPTRLELEIDTATASDDVAAAERLLALQRLAEEHHHLPLAARAAALRVAALARAGALDGLPALLAQTERAALAARGPNVYLPELLQHCAVGWRAVGDCTDEAARCIEQALQWVHAVALPNVPAEFADGFLARNRVNAALRLEAARLGRV